MEKVKLKLLCFMCPFTARYEKQVGLMHQKLSEKADEIPESAVSECLSEECKERIKAKIADSK